MLKNRTTRVATLLLALTLITCCFVGSTFAKYASSVTGETQTVTIANWAFVVNGKDIVAGETPAFDLFDTVNGQYDEEGNDVANGKVAPGTEGAFNFKVKNTSEVSLKYTVSFKVEFPTGLGSDVFKFYYNDVEINAVDGVYTVVKDVEIEVNDTAEKTIDVTWEWIFTDANENALAGQNIKITPTVSAEQVD